MTRHPFRRLIAAAAALSLGLTGPLPAHAMRASETAEGSGLEELRRTLDGSPAVATPRSTAVAHPAAGMEETPLPPLTFSHPRVWEAERERTGTLLAKTRQILKSRGERYGAQYAVLFGQEVVTGKTAYLDRLGRSVAAGVDGRLAEVEVRVADLQVMQDFAQRARFGRIIWGPEIAQKPWRDLPYNVAQALLDSEVAYVMGFFQVPENPLTDLHKAARDDKQEKALLSDGQPTLPGYVAFILGDHQPAQLAALSLAEKRTILRRALLLTLQGNAEDPNVLGKLKVGVPTGDALKMVETSSLLVNDLNAAVMDLTADTVTEAVFIQDNVGTELIGLTLLTAVYLQMFPGKKVSWVCKEAAYLTSDVTRRDLMGWQESVEGIDGRSWFVRFLDPRYTAGDSRVGALLEFMNRVRAEASRYEVVTHPWTDSGLPGSVIPTDFAQRIGGPRRTVVAIGEWLNERFVNAIPYGPATRPSGTSYEEAWGYLRELGIQRFILLRMIKDNFIVVIPYGLADLERLLRHFSESRSDIRVEKESGVIQIPQGGLVGVVSCVHPAAGMEELPMAPERFASLVDHTNLRPPADPSDAGAVAAERAAIEQTAREARAHGYALVAVRPGNPALWAADVLQGSSVKSGPAIGFRLLTAKYDGTNMTREQALERYEIPVEEKAREIQQTISAIRERFPTVGYEVDFVINVKALLDPGRGESYVHNEIRTLIQTVRDLQRPGEHITVKVIGENYFLSDGQKRSVYGWAKDAGADFVKTSTGFAPTGATEADLRLMREIVGPGVGVKAAGGIRTLDEALGMLRAATPSKIAPNEVRLGLSASVAIEEAYRKAYTAAAGLEERQRGAPQRTPQDWNAYNSFIDQLEYPALIAEVKRVFGAADIRDQYAAWLVASDPEGDRVAVEEEVDRVFSRITRLVSAYQSAQLLLDPARQNDDEFLRARLSYAWLATHPAAGMEEGGTKKPNEWILPESLARMLGDMADSDDAQGVTSVVAHLTGPTGVNTVQIVVPGAVRDQWPRQLAEACESIGVSGTTGEHWNVRVGDLVRTTQTLIVPITMLPKGATDLEHRFDMTAAQDALNVLDLTKYPYTGIAQALQNLFTRQMAYDQAVTALLLANPGAKERAIRSILNAGISWYLGFKHHVLDDNGHDGIRSFLNGDLGTKGAMKYLAGNDPALIRAILREARSFLPTAGTMTIEAFGELVRDVSIFDRHRATFPDLWRGGYRVEVTRIDDPIRVYRAELLSKALAQQLADDPEGLSSRFGAQNIPPTAEELRGPAVVLVTDPTVAPQGKTSIPILTVSSDTIPTLRQLYLVAMTEDAEWAAIPPERVVMFHVGETIWVAAFV